MKKIFYTAVLVIIHWSSYSQVTLYASDINPVIGDVFYMISSDFVTINGSSGANQSWSLNFGINNFTNHTFMATSTVGTILPSASVKVNYSSLFAEERYYGTYSDSINKLGTEDLTYTDNEKILQYPFQMGNTFTDKWACSFGSGSNITYRKGTSTVVADGYGTLQLPGGTHNVLRVKTIKTYTDSSSITFYSHVKILYDWYKPGAHVPIATIDSTTTNGSFTTVKAYYLTNIPNSVKDTYHDEMAQIGIYPNPTTNNFSIKLNKSISNLSFSLSDISGKMKEIKVTLNPNGEYFFVPFEISEGFYLLTILSNGKVIDTKQIQFL